MRLAPKKNKLKITAFWFLAIAALFIAGLVFKLGRENRSVWDGEEQINFVLAAEDVYLTSVDPQEGKLVVLKIPNGVEIKTTRGYGQYRVGAIYELGELSGRGGELLRESVQEEFGVLVEAYLKIQNTKYKIQNTKNDLLRILASSILQRKGITDFSFIDLLWLWWTIKNIPINSADFLDLSKLSVLKEETLVDGTTVPILDKERSDDLPAKYFGDSRIRNENLAIEVVNTTDHSGLANQAARIIANSGGRVVRVGNKKLKMKNEKCEVRSGKKERESLTVKKLLRIFACDFAETDLSGQQAEVILEVGEDYWKKLNGEGGVFIDY